MFTISARKRGFTLIELMVVTLILAVLTAVCLPLYLKSVFDSEENACKTNMSSIASAEQAHKVRTVGPYWSGTVDSAAAENSGPLRDLHNAVPVCPGSITSNYTVQASGGGFIVRCTNPRHRFQWHSGVWEMY